MKTIFVAVSLIAIPLVSKGDVCSERLLDKDFLTGSSAVDQRAFDHSLICRSEFREFQKSKGGSAGGSFVKVSGKATYNESEYNKYKKESCKEGSSSQYNSSMVFYAHKVLSSEAIQGYVNCKKNEVFSCWVEPQGTRNAAFVVHRGTGAAEYVTENGAIVDGNVTVLDNSLSKGAKIKYGPQSVVVRRNDTKSVHFSINVANKIASNSCQAYIAAELDEPEVSCVNQYGTNIDFDGDGCSDRWVNNNNSIFIELGNGRSFPITLSETWETNVGVWLEADFDGDSRTDLIQIVNEVVERPDYAHTICKISGREDYVALEPFNFRKAANPQGDYCVSCGPWSVVDANSDRYSDLQHNSNIGPRNIHKWISTGQCGVFEIR